MSAKIARRVGIVAGLVLLPTVAFGAVANAAPAPQETAPGPAVEEQAHPDRLPKIKVRGQITDVVAKDLHGRQVLLITIGGPKDGKPKEFTFAVTPRTVVEQDGHRVPASELTKGDHVTAIGSQLPHQHLAVAKHVTINQ
jgi:hypothetical protein